MDIPFPFDYPPPAQEILLFYIGRAAGLLKDSVRYIFVPSPATKANLPHLALWIFARLLVLLALVGSLFDRVLPILGNVWLPPRHDRPSMLPPGLSLVDTNETSIPYQVDIVFVHGLGSFPDTTWRKQDPIGHDDQLADLKDVSWVRDLLPDDVETARLVYFNYDSTTYNDAPQKQLEDFGLDLRNAFIASSLRTAKEEHTRPIIFICHSYGGLVVKEALVQAAKDPNKNPDLLINIKGIIFLGTPHFGTRYSHYARQAALRLNQLASNPDIFLPLSINSTQLIRLHDDFLDNFRDLDMINFFETHKQLIFRFPFSHLAYRAMIVDKASATFRAPNTTNDNMDTDHSGLNKFNSPVEKGYTKIVFYLNAMIRKLDRVRRQQKEQEEQDALKQHNTSGLVPEPDCRSKSRYIVPGETVKSYTERPRLMAQLRESLDNVVETSDPPRSVLLWGIGGGGKSQLALRYIEINRNRYDPIIWIDANKFDTAAKSYHEAFQQLDLDYPTHPQDELRKAIQGSDTQIPMKKDWIIPTVLSWLEQRRDEHCEWLVILDNVNSEDLNWIRDIKPRGRRGSLIITSRDRTLDHLTNHAIHVDIMTPEEAKELLFRGGTAYESQSDRVNTINRWKSTQDPQVLSIIDRLGYLAIAVNSAAAYIAQNDGVRENLTRYLDYLDDASYDLLETDLSHLGHPHAKTLASVWESSYGELYNASPEAADLLTLLAHLNCPSIEDRLFLEGSARLVELKNLKRFAFWIILFLECLAIVLVPEGLCALLRYCVPSPELSQRGVRRAKVFLIAVPLLLNSACMALIAIIRVRRVSAGNTVQRAGYGYAIEDAIIVFFTAMGFHQPCIADWLIKDRSWLITVLPVVYSLSVVLTWVWSRFLESSNAELDDYIAALLLRLDFSEASIKDVARIMGGIQHLQSQALGWKFLLELAWVIFWRGIVWQFVMVGLIIVIFGIWDVILKIALSFFNNPGSPSTRWRTFGWLIIMATSWACKYVISFAIGVAIGSTEAYSWTPLQEKKEWHVNSDVIAWILKYNEEEDWNRRPYSELMAHITRLSLMQRNADQSYSMHPLVQWWALKRLPISHRKAWVSLAETLIWLVYQSTTCWKDDACQRILVPHLIRIASEDVLQARGRFWILKQFLNMLFRSLKHIQRNDIAKLLEVRHEYTGKLN